MASLRRSTPAGPINAEEVLITAEAFEEAAAIVGDVMRKAARGPDEFSNRLGRRLGRPWAVIGAFSVELYLKCLLAIENRPYPKDHNLKKLFRSLAPATQAILRGRHDAIMQAKSESLADVRRYGKIDLESLLEQGQDTFVYLRYPYERRARDGVLFGLGLFRECVRERILTLRPDWVGASLIRRGHGELQPDR
jgi:hypothetical protein